MRFITFCGRARLRPGSLVAVAGSVCLMTGLVFVDAQAKDREGQVIESLATAQVRSAAVPSRSSPDSVRGSPSDKGTRCGWGQPRSAPEQLQSPATASGTPGQLTDPAPRRQANTPMSFEANQGQTDGEVKFLSRGRGYTLFLTPTQ